MSEYKLMGIYKISGQIKLETGLHIGGDEGVIEIGGNDNPIVRDIATENPYIPGSSLKGKMRYLLEWYTGKVTSDGKVYDGKNLSKDSEGERIGVIQGSKGKIISEEAPGLVGKVTLKLYDGTTESFDDGFSKDRVVPEFKAFIRAINENDLEFCYRQLEKSLLVSEVQTKARIEAGIKFPQD